MAKIRVELEINDRAIRWVADRCSTSEAVALKKIRKAVRRRARVSGTIFVVNYDVRVGVERAIDVRTGICPYPLFG